MDLLQDGRQEIRALAVSSDGSTLVAATTDAHVHCWRAANAADGAGSMWKAGGSFHAHVDYITRMHISPDSKLLCTTSADKTAKLWRTEDLAHQTTLAQHMRWVWDCAFSADSAYVVTASSDNTAKLWEAASGEALRCYVGHALSVTAVALNDKSD